MKLLSPKGLVSRPITDRVKESLFNVLKKYGLPEDCVAADLFCGVGSLGLEALSRGAAFITFVEKDPKVATVLKKNISKAGFVKKSKVIRADAWKVGTLVGLANRKYDLIFVDPPYALTGDVGTGSQLDKLMQLISRQLGNRGYVIVRTRRKTELPERYGDMDVVERRSWGTMRVTILQKAGR